ncbi:MAG: putative PEP-binding protein, partial [Candidatus Aerophobetes bacterium]|nr:putative PEP-binding protein [Candidatus Aerophobetes bacterium]
LKNGSEKKIAEKERILQRVRTLHEMNPMMGHRGCRLGITFPEVYKMQARAVLGAAAELIQEGIKVHPEIMIPLVANERELSILRKEAREVAEEIMKDKRIQFEYKIGTMIELPRSTLCADKIAEFADFFSFGTNDLTQTTFGFSRDDAEGKFIPIYIERNIIEDDPFQVLDQEGVGELVKIGTERGHKANSALEVGICGEHGGEPSSVKFCHRVGLDYVSCSPYRIPIARLAAAQAKIEEDQD